VVIGDWTISWMLALYVVGKHVFQRLVMRTVYLRLWLIVLIAGVLAVIRVWAHGLRVILRSCGIGQILPEMRVLRVMARDRLLARLLTLLIVHHATLLLWSSLSIVSTRRAHDDGVVGMGLDMFLEILWALESLATEFAFVGLERDVDSNMGGDVVAFDGGGSALAPLAGQVEVISRLAADMTLADMFLLNVSTL
jgi:hypothetical protein